MSVFGPRILTRTLSATARPDRYGNLWQYHPRSDHHSKVACGAIAFDLLRHCPLLRRHVEIGAVAFGINHEMRDFVHNRKKNLDLVLCTPAGDFAGRTRKDLPALVDEYAIGLSADERRELDALPGLRRASVGSVLLALEAKACMTAHQRALPRLYDELNSSHATVHAASGHAIAAGFAMVNVAAAYLSPDLNKANRAVAPEWSRHRQPRDAELAVDKLRQLPRRTRIDDEGYDALAITVVSCRNDGSAVDLVETPPAPAGGDIDHYAAMIERVANLYATRFKDLA